MSLGTMGPTRDVGPAIVDWGATTVSEIFEEVRLALNAADAAEVFEAIHGRTPVDSVCSGVSECSVIVPATRIALATFATLLADAGTNPGGAAEAVGIVPSGAVGVSMYDNGLPLLVKPIIAGIAASNGTWMRLERTYPMVRFDVAFNLTDQRTYGLEFKAHPEATIGPGLLWSAGIVNGGVAY